MAYTNLEALNELIQKIKAGEGTAKSNLEALNMLCVIAGGTGAARSNLEALNELLRVFTPGGETQEKSVTITENGTTEITPDEGYTLSKAVVVTEVPSKPEQEKSVTITENGTTQITPDEGYTLSGASVSVNVSGESAYNVKCPTIVQNASSANSTCLEGVTEIDFTKTTWENTSRKDLNNFFRQFLRLKKIIWGNLPNTLASSQMECGNMFNGCGVLEEIDLTGFGNKTITNASFMFTSCSSLKNIKWGSIKIQSSSLLSMFNACSELKTIDASFLDENYTGVTNINSCFRNCGKLTEVNLASLKTSKITQVASAFAYCTSLTNIIFESDCFSNSSMTSLDLSNSPLSHDCAVDIFNKLATRTNSPSIKLSAATKGYLTADEIAIATNKGWVIS